MGNWPQSLTFPLRSIADGFFRSAPVIPLASTRPPNGTMSFRKWRLRSSIWKPSNHFTVLKPPSGIYRTGKLNWPLRLPMENRRGRSLRSLACRRPPCRASKLVRSVIYACRFGQHSATTFIDEVGKPGVDSRFPGLSAQAARFPWFHFVRWYFHKHVLEPEHAESALMANPVLLGKLLTGSFGHCFA